MKVKIITAIEDLPQLSTEHPTFCDIETEKLYVNTRLIQFYQPKTDDTVYIFDVAPLGYKQNEYSYMLETVKDFLRPLHTVWYNASYDLGTLNFLTTKTDDLFYAIKTAYCEFMEFSLDTVVSKMGYDGMYKDLDKKKIQKAGFIRGSYLSQAQIQYSATDVYVLSKLWEDQKVQNVITNNLAYKVDILSQRYAIQYQQNGLVVDLVNRNKYLEESRANVAKWTKELPEGFNPNSYKQVRAYLDVEDSDHEALVKYALSEKEKAPKARAIIELKKSLKEVSYLESINFDKMYTKFNVAGAATGRFTSSGGDIINGFNAQQIPRQFQKLFKADTECGRADCGGDECSYCTTVVDEDYATLELRLACAIFNEPEMYEQLKRGEDLHTEMAKFVTGKPLHPDGLQGDKYAASGLASVDIPFVTHKDRTDAKAVNFGYVFGMSAATYQNYAFVSYGVKVTLEEAEKLRNAYFTKYPNFKRYHNRVWENYKKPSFFYSTALGRRVKPKLGTDGINGPVQGSGAETTKLAVHFLIKADCERLGLDSTTEWHKCDAIKYIYNVVHDAIYLRVPKKDKSVWVERLQSAMHRGWTEISKSSLFAFKDIPMPIGD